MFTSCPDIYRPYDEPAEDYAPYQRQSTCDPDPKPGVVLFRDYVLRHFGGGDLGIYRDCDAPGTSEHEEGRAWDWGVIPGAVWPPGSPYSDPSLPETFIECFTGNDIEGNPAAQARRAGIMYMIYNGRIWRSYNKPGEPRGQWHPYSKAATLPHTDHIHISFSWPGARAQTSFYRRLRQPNT
jgi:hypothetical protein